MTRRCPKSRFRLRLPSLVVSCLTAVAPAARTTPLGAQPAGSRPSASDSVATGAYTYPGTGSVNTHWVATPDGGLVVIDVQRDLAHAREALAAVRAVGRPVRAILVTHGHPDHYAGVGLFKQAYPDAAVWSSATTRNTIRDDPFRFNAFMRRSAPGNFPDRLTLPDRVFAGDTTLTLGGLTVVARELGKAEANSATAYYVPASGDLYAGDLVLYRMHALLAGPTSARWLTALDRLHTFFPGARTLHPGHGDSGPADTLLASQREYLTTARAIAAEARREAGPGKAGEARAAAEIKQRYATYGFPSGLPDIVGVSVRGLFQELRAADAHPQASGQPGAR